MHKRCLFLAWPSQSKIENLQVNEKSEELKRRNIGMVKKGRRQGWDGVVHMVHKDSMHGE